MATATTDANEIEQTAQREYLYCPKCEQDVRTTAAEGIPAQVLRACNECGAVFSMDLSAAPRYEPRSDN